MISILQHVYDYSRIGRAADVWTRRAAASRDVANSSVGNKIGSRRRDSPPTTGAPWSLRFIVDVYGRNVFYARPGINEVIS